MNLNDNEQYRMQIAGITSAAFGWWKEGSSVHPEYDTPALRDVARLYAKYEALYKEKEAAITPEPTPLRQALEETLAWFETERKSISKGNGSTWSMLQCQEQIDRIRQALAPSEEESESTNKL